MDFLKAIKIIKKHPKYHLLMRLYNNLDTLRHFSAEDLDDENLVSLIVLMNGFAIRQVSERLQHDRNIIKLALKSKPYSYFYLKDEYQNDREIALLSFKYYPENLSQLKPLNKHRKYHFQNLYKFGRIHNLKIYDFKMGINMKNLSYHEVLLYL